MPLSGDTLAVMRANGSAGAAFAGGAFAGGAFAGGAFAGAAFFAGATFFAGAAFFAAGATFFAVAIFLLVAMRRSYRRCGGAGKVTVRPWRRPRASAATRARTRSAPASR